MKTRNLIFLTAVLLSTACGVNDSDPGDFNVIPYPESVEFYGGRFNAAGKEFHLDSSLDREIADAAGKFAEHLTLVTGKTSSVSFDEGKRGFIFCKDSLAQAESYTIQIKRNSVLVSAGDYNGFIWAMQTLGQMFPPEWYSDEKADVAFTLPCGCIKDKPRFGYRGVLIDSGRHFFSVEEIKRCLDIMSIYKENRFHWHLTEDQGWRLEIKKYPRLTEIGSRRAQTQIEFKADSLDGIPHGGYYTQDQIRDVVDYAAKRGITVIPEIDLPGHMQSALASYPSLGCTGGPYQVAQTWGVKKDVLCVGKEETFTFIEDVLTEVLDLFPSEYINIGGDEVPKDRWENCPACQKRIRELGLKDKDGHTAEQYLQNYVTARVQKWLNDRGRKMIGWEEILEGELAEGATVMTWRGTGENVDSRIWNYDVVMSPRGYMYIDRYQSHEQDREPFSIGAYLPVENVYGYEPYDDVPEYGKSRILGVQANLWTEFIGTDEYLEYMLLPRLAALSEVQWCQSSKKEWSRFRKSLDHSVEIYKKLGLTWCEYAWGIVGMGENRQKARTAQELQQYLDERE